MPPDVYERLLSRVGFVSTRHVAEFFGVSHSSAQKWAKDGPSPPVEKMLLLMRAKGWKPEDVDGMIAGPEE